MRVPVRSERTPAKPGFLEATDRLGQPIDLKLIEPLLDRIVAAWHPKQIWLFGSRSRGDAQPGSDWDLFAVVPDDVPESELGPLAAWRLRKAAGVPADVFPCTAMDFADAGDTPNTIAFDVRREGVLLYEH